MGEEETETLNAPSRPPPAPADRSRSVVLTHRMDLS